MSETRAAEIERLRLGGVGLDPAVTHGCLMTVAETLQQTLLPALDASAHKSAGYCIDTLLYLAASLKAPQDSAAAIDAMLAAPTPRARVDAEAACLQEACAHAVELARKVRSAGPTQSRQIDAARLERYLRAQPAGGDALRVRSATALQGGRSKLTILVGVENANSLPDELVFRQDWSGAVTGTSVAAMEFAILQRAHAAGICVPQPLLLENGSDALGAPFIVVARAAGKPLGDIFEPPPSAQAVRELAAQIARIHTLPLAEVERLPGVSEQSYTAEQRRGELVKYRAVIEQLGGPLPAFIPHAFDWLLANIERVNSPRTLVHGDCGWHNNLVDGEHLSAILDWEMAHIGSPALDLGWIRTAAEQAIPWDEFLCLYHQAGGPAVDAFAIDWYDVFRKLWLVHLVVQARAAVASGAIHDVEYAQIAARYGPAVVMQLSRALQRALANHP